MMQSQPLALDGKIPSSKVLYGRRRSAVVQKIEAIKREHLARDEHTPSEIGGLTGTSLDNFIYSSSRSNRGPRLPEMKRRR
jgi:hypothetical protein